MNLSIIFSKSGDNIPIGPLVTLWLDHVSLFNLSKCLFYRNSNNQIWLCIMPKLNPFINHLYNSFNNVTTTLPNPNIIIFHRQNVTNSKFLNHFFKLLKCTKTIGDANFIPNLPHSTRPPKIQISLWHFPHTKVHLN